MFDRSLVTFGFDTETLISEDYLTPRACRREPPARRARRS